MYLPVCLFICLSIYLSFYLFVCLPVYLSIALSLSSLSASSLTIIMKFVNEI